MSRETENSFRLNRRAFLGRHAGALGTLALAHLLDTEDRRTRAAGFEAGSDVRPDAFLPAARPAQSR